MKNRIVTYGLLAMLLYAATAYTGKAVTSSANIKFTFINTVKGVPIVLNDSTYTNSFGESYSIKNLKYYISNIGLADKKENHQLVDEANENSKSFSISTNPGTCTNVFFTIGVDSLYNVSGAQTDALDPMNGMFWTWNSGYIMAKLEGSSSASSQVNHRFEYHIGGFSGVNNVVKKIRLPFTAPLVIQEGKTVEIIVEADIDKWWQSPNNITITETPVCTTPGELAKKIADNYSKLFTIKTVIKN